MSSPGSDALGWQMSESTTVPAGTLPDLSLSPRFAGFAGNSRVAWRFCTTTKVTAGL